MSLVLFTRGFIDVGLLGENHHKINLIIGESLSFNEGAVPFLWITSDTTLLNG
jgi:hypothetical protein